MARPGGFSATQLTLVRAGVTAADAIAPFTDANYPAANGISCKGFDTIYIGVEFVGGATPTATFEILQRDPDAADGSRWKLMLVGSNSGITQVGAPASLATPALDGTSMAEVRVDGRQLVYIRAKAVTGAPTSFSVLATGGVRRYVQNHNE